MVAQLPEGDLLELTAKLNPYSQSAANVKEKTALFSFTNFKADYYQRLKAISL